LAELIAEGLHQDSTAADIAFDDGETLYRSSVTRDDLVAPHRDPLVVHGADVRRRLGDGPRTRVC
jgi:hypothetical protein